MEASMKHRILFAAAGCAAGVGLSILLLGRARAQNDEPLAPPPTEGTQASRTPDSVVRQWPDAARATARAMIAKYGQPVRWSEAALVWVANGPWEKTVVYRSAWPHFTGRRDKDYLEQTIAYRVPAEKFDALRRFDKRISIDGDTGQLSARSESESTNFLTMNLADEIVTGKREVADARDFYKKTVSLSKSGKSSPYMSGLLFPPQEQLP
jgi:hypothetical protein